jgi:hypothetical protein
LKITLSANLYSFKISDFGFIERKFEFNANLLGTHTDGYSMADILYKWGIDGKGSVGLSENVELPQFKVQGLKQFQKVEVLSTG